MKGHQHDSQKMRGLGCLHQAGGSWGVTDKRRLSQAQIVLFCSCAKARSAQILRGGAQVEQILPVDEILEAKSCGHFLHNDRRLCALLFQIQLRILLLTKKQPWSGASAAALPSPSSTWCIFSPTPQKTCRKCEKRARCRGRCRSKFLLLPQQV